MKRPNAHVVIPRLAAERGWVTNADVQKALGVSRQAAQQYLAALAREGLLERAGAGRGSRYRLQVKPAAQFVVPLRGLAEDELWNEFAAGPVMATLSDNVRSILRFAFTEMLNNAVDHSGGTTARVRVFADDGSIAFDVEDDGVGIFEHVMQARGLRTPFEAIAELQKGKVTTAPRVHTGEGIFFTSKIADKMTLESGATRWIIDTIGEDQAAETAPTRSGTRVYVEIDRGSFRTTKQVFDKYSDPDRGFTRTRTSVKLFREGGEMVSRSEAKRLLAGLEKFEEIELDFKELAGIGQGFADEVFRVWQNEHPTLKLIVLNANAAVRYMIDRARATAAKSGSADIGARFGVVVPSDSDLQSVPTVNIVVGESTRTSGGTVGIDEKGAAKEDKDGS